MKLHFGNVDMPYTNEKQSVTTGQVATFLEAKYHIYETFAVFHEEAIRTELAESVADAIENIVLGAPVPADPYAAAATHIEHEFRVFLSEEQMATLGIDGVPTLAALLGVTHRKGAKKGERRPSFIDTGLYESTMRAWVEL